MLSRRILAAAALLCAPLTVSHAQTTFLNQVILNGNAIPGTAPNMLEVYTDNTVNQANIVATTYGIDGGGVMHVNMANGTRSAPTAVTLGQITGGIGSRPYNGAGFLASSPASIHWVADEDFSPTNNGAHLRFLTTPVGASQSRQERTLITADGTLWTHSGGTGGVSGFSALDAAQTKPVSDILVLASSANSSGSPSPNVAFGAYSYGGTTAGYRAAVAGGTPSAPTATPSGSILGFLGASGYGTTRFSATAGLLSIVSTQTFSDANNGTDFVVEVTPTNANARVERLRVKGNGVISMPGGVASTSTTTGTAVISGGLGASGAIYGGAEVTTGATTVALLPTCDAAHKAARHFVTDSNAPSFTAAIGLMVFAGGTTNVPVTCDGANWRVGANDSLPQLTKAA